MNIHQFKTKIITYDILFGCFISLLSICQENTLNTEKDVSTIFCHALVIRSLRQILLNGPGKRGHIVADTLLPMMFLGLRKLGNICCGHKMFLNKIRNIFVSRTHNLCPQQMLRSQATETWENSRHVIQSSFLNERRNNATSQPSWGSFFLDRTSDINRLPVLLKQSSYFNLSATVFIPC